MEGVERGERMSRRLESFAVNREAERRELPPVMAEGLGGIEHYGSAGCCYLIERAYDEALGWQPSPLDWLQFELELVYGVGPRTAEGFRTGGIRSLDQLTDHPRFGAAARQVLRAIEQRDVLTLLNLGASDAALLSFYQPGELVFMDIETTSLYSTQPLFMVGLLSADGGRLVLRQYFARRYDEEPGVLGSVLEDLSRFRVMVTYNGRSFDLPYLNSRLTAHRLKSRFTHVHLDLLRHARRRYKAELPNCRLCTVEENVLGQRREDDIPGEMAPMLYHDFVRTQNPTVIQGVIEHNARDLLALARILPRLA